MNFRMWMEKQDWEGLFLDKDIIVKGNKCYSPDTCIFVTRQVNSILIDRAADRGGCVVGVSWSKSNGKYCAKCSVDSKQVNLGFYDSEEEASFAYRVFKGNVVKVIAAVGIGFVSKKLLLGKSSGLIKKIGGLLIELGVADLLTKKKRAEAPVAAAVEKIPAAEQEK